MTQNTEGFLLIAKKGRPLEAIQITSWDMEDIIRELTGADIEIIDYRYVFPDSQILIRHIENMFYYEEFEKKSVLEAIANGEKVHLHSIMHYLMVEKLIPDANYLIDCGE